jgi:hypothetical protein
MPLPVDDSDIPESLAEIASEMERTYITNDQWYRVQEPWWAAVADVNYSNSQEESTDG